ncbi:uncharacterized protein LOC107706719 [Sinocyclocheilus rhinocerous]|uniref:uncharacterized protein LOC107706719 n=1 Tax=Sinocyclocheilus rhinocerous TaxID=307959 RepID=UPI0007B9D070|nr:PREDICTED: uncharacterized protein LOC107706719 [Sinocyclocheilus rhinocerous]
MEKRKEKESGPYRDKLNVNAKQRYFEKLKTINDVDPYELPAPEWISDPEALPPLTYPDIVNYLVFGLSAYTITQFKCYKSLDAYEQFCSGWVQDLLSHRPANCDFTVVLAKVMHSQRLSEAPLKAWVIISSTGEVSSAHCTCMAGVAETCTHVGALLFKVEATVRCREMRTVTDKPAYWILPSNVNKVHSEVGHQIDYTSASATRKSLNGLLNAETVSRPGLRTCARKLTTPPPTHSELTQFYADLHKADGKSAILSVLPQYCEEFKDPVQPVTNVQSLLCLRDTSLDECDFTIVI